LPSTSTEVQKHITKLLN